MWSTIPSFWHFWNYFNKEHIKVSILKLGEKKHKNNIFESFIYNSGSIHYPYHLTSENYISDQMKQKINRITSIMMENGIHQQIQSYNHWAHVIGICGANEEVDLITFTLEQLKRPMMLIISLWTFTALIFIAEISVHKWINWRKRK